MILSVSFLSACAEKEDSSQQEETILIETISATAPVITETIPEETFTETETTAPETESETETSRIPPDGELVRILDYIPDAVIDLRYATENNFTNTVIYDDAEAYLCYGTVKKLCKVQEELKENGFRMILWDAYRSVEAQYKLWEVYPDPTYVADPRNGRITSHSKGNTIDIGIVYKDGSEVELPSAFDEFSSLADRDYSDVSETAAEHSKFLENIMEKHGFSGYWGEWWDYSDLETYDLIIPET
ncbi:MAG: M15 family metallopeptidase [Oscillospiraceae bacterium]|nr:M15 family metallopeptidase [Oscillospiraceae bacterium]